MEIATVVIGIIIGVLLLTGFWSASRRVSKRRLYGQRVGTSAVQPPAADSHDSDHRFSEQHPAQPEHLSRHEKQLKATSQVDFEPRELFNKSETSPNTQSYYYWRK